MVLGLMLTLLQPNLHLSIIYFYRANMLIGKNMPIHTSVEWSEPTEHRAASVSTLSLTNHLYVQLLNIFKYYFIIMYYAVENNGAVRECIESVAHTTRCRSPGTKCPVGPNLAFQPSRH